MSEHSNQSDIIYLSGFGSYISTEAIPNTLPNNQNSPQSCSYGLYAEQLSGTAFTAPRHKNLHSWLYRIRPSVITATDYESYDSNGRYDIYEGFQSLVIEPKPLRWNPLDIDDIPPTNFIEGLQVVCGTGDPSLKEGLCIYNYVANSSMINTAFYSSDGDFLIVPEQGSMIVITELGRLIVNSSEIVVIPRGIRFSIQIINNESIRGYALEAFSGHFELPSLGVIGSNGLANPRDFLIPTAWYEDIDNQSAGENYSYNLINKYMGKLFKRSLNHSPFDVVGWHGNYYPFKYDLKHFNTINTVSYDHLDPSIFTVLTCPSNEPGVAIADFVIFPPRWMVAEHTFRPPYFHRNCMSEYMGMIYGKYDGKGDGFVPGGSSLHSVMTPHGPDAGSFVKASHVDLSPVYFNEGLAFMFETNYLLKVSTGYLHSKKLQSNYWQCWADLPKLFSPP
mmetsp:Transcript_19964/g.18132  ORF Transcript_19964/g.18132 Transcript_19964/m.18132 type:complete len:449 (+) Transcript_19964:1474-2820(+)